MTDRQQFTRAQFVADLRSLHISQRQFAELVGLHPMTVYHWGTEEKLPFPAWVPVLLAAWRDNRRLLVELGRVKP